MLPTGNQLGTWLETGQTDERRGERSKFKPLSCQETGLKETHVHKKKKKKCVDVKKGTQRGSWEDEPLQDLLVLQFLRWISCRTSLF